MPLQFAFLKRGLDPAKAHIIRVVVKNEKNPRSTGTAVRHLVFEYSADSYRASDCYSSVPGKNQWYNQERNGGAYRDMTFKEPELEGPGRLRDRLLPHDARRQRRCAEMGGPAGGRGPSRGPRDAGCQDHGRRQRCHPAQHQGNLAGADRPGQAAVHSLNVTVAQGDAVYFIAGKKDAAGGRIEWDPAVTYMEPARKRAGPQLYRRDDRGRRHADRDLQ